jgi:hypothetical protein
MCVARKWRLASVRHLLKIASQPSLRRRKSLCPILLTGIVATELKLLEGVGELSLPTDRRFQSSPVCKYWRRKQLSYRRVIKLPSNIKRFNFLEQITKAFYTTYLSLLLRYKSECRGFDSRYHWNFLSTEYFRPHHGPRFDSVSNRNEYQGYLPSVKVAGD